MTPFLLNRPFIGLSISKSDYRKVKGLLPTPSYTDTFHSYDNQKILLIYAIEGYVTSSNQFRWISNIKLGLKKFLFVPFEFIDEFHVTDTAEITNIIYSLEELSKAFKAPLITYPKIMYPTTKKELYRRLCWYGKALTYQEVFTKDILMATALLMNNNLKDKFSNKDLHKKVLGAYIWICENRDGFKVKLNEEQLKEAHSRGARIKNHNQAQKTQEKIEALLRNGNFIKPNGKVNISLLAKTMNMNRKTVAKYMV